MSLPPFRRPNAIFMHSWLTYSVSTRSLRSRLRLPGLKSLVTTSRLAVSLVARRYRSVPLGGLLVAELRRPGFSRAARDQWSLEQSARSADDGASEKSGDARPKGVRSRVASLPVHVSETSLRSVSLRVGRDLNRTQTCSLPPVAARD